MTETPTFSEQEAQALVNLAANAPQANLASADHARALLQKFVAWYRHATKPSEPDTPDVPA